MVSVQDILDKLPYGASFRFVDGLTSVDENGASGHVAFKEESDFQRGHFPGNPVVPGVILTEAMAQIGVVCLGIFLMEKERLEGSAFALTSTEVEFLKPVSPGERVAVTSEKIYFRFGKLKCKVVMTKSDGTEVCNGTIAGMLLKP